MCQQTERAQSYVYAETSFSNFIIMPRERLSLRIYLNTLLKTDARVGTSHRACDVQHFIGFINFTLFFPPSTSRQKLQCLRNLSSVPPHLPLIRIETVDGKYVWNIPDL